VTSVDAVTRAVLLIETQRFAQARDILSRHLATDPNDANALCVLAQAYLGLDDYPAALAAAQAAAASEPQNEWAQRLASLTLTRIGRFAEARARADAALRLAPNEWRTHAQRARVDVSADAVSPSTLRTARQAVRLAPWEQDAHSLLGSALLADKQFDEAELEFREALRIDPQSHSTHNEMARLHLARRDIGAAAAGFAGAAALSPADDTAARNLTVVGARALRYVHLVMWIALLVTTKFRDQHGGPVNRTALAVGWVAATAVLAVFGARLHRGSEGKIFRLMLIVVRRDRLLAAWAIGLAVAYGGFAAAALAPSKLVSLAGLLAAAAGIVIGAILSWVRGRRQRRG
jgi:tetratricopeptide (TPR) repeat protein